MVYTLIFFVACLSQGEAPRGKREGYVYLQYTRSSRVSARGGGLPLLGRLNPNLFVVPHGDGELMVDRICEVARNSTMCGEGGGFCIVLRKTPRRQSWDITESGKKAGGLTPAVAL
jgi:hypothetical protein